MFAFRKQKVSQINNQNVHLKKQNNKTHTHTHTHLNLNLAEEGNNTDLSRYN